MRAGDESFERLRAAIEQMAATDVPELLLEARVEARARVRSMLTEALAQSLLEQARDQLESPSPAPLEASPPPAVPVPVNEGALALYVYGVVAAGDAIEPALPGIAGAGEVTTVSRGDVAALVSPVPLAQFDEQPLREHLADPVWLERTARGHEAVLDAVGARHTVVPMRLCSIYRDESGIRTMLERESEGLRGTLERLDGRSEWGVKVFRIGAARVEHDPVASSVTPSDKADAGAAYMEGRRREQQQRRDGAHRLEETLALIHERLCARAGEGLVLSPQRPEVSGHAGEMMLNGAYLVDDTAREDFAAEVAELGRELASLGLELERTGPWPAYNFVDGTLGASL